MAVFRIKLAEIPIEVTAAFDSTKDFCKEYLTEEAPLFSVVITREHIEKMRELDRKTAAAEGHEPCNKSDSYLETLSLAYVVLEKLIEHNVLMFHGSVVAVNGMAYMFTAKSGTGKTTHIRLWQKCFPDCHVLNGDKPLILFRRGKIFACGSPWMGKENYGVNEILPLEAVCILSRSETNCIEEIPLKECFDALLNQCHIPGVNANLISSVKLLHDLSAVKLYRLKCNMKDEAAWVSYNAMVT